MKQEKQSIKPKINILFDDTGISIIELLEKDYEEFLDYYVEKNNLYNKTYKT